MRVLSPLEKEKLHIPLAFDDESKHIDEKLSLDTVCPSFKGKLLQRRMPSLSFGSAHTVTEAVLFPKYPSKSWSAK